MSSAAVPDFEKEENLIKIEGTIATIRFTDDTQGTAIFSIDVDENKNRVIALGKVLYPIVGERIIVEGFYQKHPDWGDQLKVVRYDKPTPATREGIVRYLSCDLFKGIGEKTAHKIVDTLGTECIQTIINDPSTLAAVPRMKNKAKHIAEQLTEHRAMEGALTFLFRYGIQQSMAQKLYRIYGGALKDIISNNPYRLILDVKGIAFKTADLIARQTNEGLESIERVEAAILEAVRMSSVSGHVFFPVKKVATAILEFLPDIEMTRFRFREALSLLVNQDRLILRKYKGRSILYLPENFTAERDLVGDIYRLMNGPNKVHFSGDMRRFADAIGRSLRVPYDDVQKGAITTFLTHNVSIITGGPGVGKTTVIKGIIRAIERVMSGTDFDILTCAPTGRAASRIAETTGYPSATVHFALELDPGTHKSTYHANNPLPYNIIILDEASMAGIRDAAKLFAAIRTGSKVIIVGDQFQLPSVQTGAVLRDLIRSGVIPVTRLERIYRTAKDSPIPYMAQRIKQGEIPYNIAPNFVMRYLDVPEDVMEKVRLAIQYELSKGKKLEDVLVLSPMYGGPGGVTALNLMIQETFNPRKGNEPEWILNHRLGIRVHKGSRVMQLKNNRQIGVMNGEIGVVRRVVLPDPDAVDEDEQSGYMLIQFGRRTVQYTPENIKHLTLSYACSIHKMQGSESKVIIHVLLNRHFKLLYRSLLYTGITRAAERAYLFTEAKALHIAISTVQEMQRYSRLSMLLRASTMYQRKVS